MARRFKGPLSGRGVRGGGYRRGGRSVGKARPLRTPRGIGSAFGLEINQFKSYFFTVADWAEILEPAEFELLRKIGMDLREQARRLVKVRKKPSRKGSSPSSWNRHLLKKNIYYGLSRKDMAVFAGPTKLPRVTASKPLSQPTIPAVLQFGGKIWHADPASYEPPRVRNREGLPGRRVVRIAPRPYMDKALKQKWKKIVRMSERMIDKSPTARMIAQNKGRTLQGMRPIGD